MIFASGSVYRLQTDDPSVVRKAKTWAFACEAAWGVSCYLYVFLIPREKAKWVASALGLPIPKRPRSEGQMAQTRRLVEGGLSTRFGAMKQADGYSMCGTEAACS
jgi:hypothetical protein